MCPSHQKHAAKHPVKLQRDQPRRRHRVEHLPHPLRAQQHRHADDYRQKNRDRQQRTALAPSRNIPPIAALQTTASHNVNGIKTANQTLRLWVGVNSACSSPSHRPSANITWMKTRTPTVCTPLAETIGKL